jgi:hypothetical protein
MVSGSLSASTRRGLFVVMVAALLCGASGLRAQDAPDSLKLSGDAAVLIWTVKAAGAADFESAWGAIKAKLVASEKPDMKELGTSLNMFKVTAAGAAGGPVVYVFTLNPPSKALSYDPAKILYAPDMWPRAEADALFKKIGDAFEGITALPLAKVGS